MDSDEKVIDGIKEVKQSLFYYVKETNKDLFDLRCNLMEMNESISNEVIKVKKSLSSLRRKIDELNKLNT